MSVADDYGAYAAIADFAERERVSRLARRMRELEAAPRKMAAYADISRQEGIPEKTLQRLFAQWKKGGDLALADKRKLSRATVGSVFYSDFKTYAERDLNGDKGAYETMLRDFRAGAAFSFGTWRDIFRAEFPNEPVPPFCPAGWIPRGFSYQRMNQLQLRNPDRRMAIAWHRQGQFAASAFSLPVIRSRVGLPVGAVFQADDVWHNIDVFAPCVSGTFQPLEFAIYDVASAFKVVSAIKPRTLTVDPKTGKEVRDNLKEMQFRFALQYLVACRGFHKDGATFILERGTTAIRDNVQRRVAAVPGFGSLIRFQTSGILNQPAFRGVAMGNAGGNPRMKSLCECSHNIMHAATASLLGSHGRDAAHMIENNARSLRAAEHDLELARKIDPSLIPYLQLDILQFDDYVRYFYILQDDVMDRTDHDLEGWADREVVEYRLSTSSDVWTPISALQDMSPDEVAATTALINRDRDNHIRKRKLSRREAWKAGQKDLVKWPIFDLPAFADPRDMREAKVRADGTISFTDSVYYPGTRKIYLAEIADRNGVRRRLPVGETVRFFWNPLGELANQIWLADADGNVLGVAPILQTAAWTSPESIKAAMGQKMHQVASAMADTRARHSQETVRRLVAAKFNEFLLQAAKEAQGLGGATDGDSLTADEILSVAASAQRQISESADFDALDFLKRI